MSELLDPVFLLGQLRSGLTTAMFLFLIASGLSLIFGVLKIINFAHGSLYMIGAYIAWNMTEIVGRTSIGFLGPMRSHGSSLGFSPWPRRIECRPKPSLSQ